MIPLAIHMKALQNKFPKFGAPNEHSIFLMYTVVAFFASRFIYYVFLDIHYDVTPLTYYWQYLDPVLLQEHLLQSIYYLHHQPPLFNLLIGILLKIVPEHYTHILSIAYFGLGVILTISIFSLLTRLGVSNRISMVLTILFVINPELVLFENLLFYEYPIVVLLCLSALFIHKFLSGNSSKDLIALFLILFMLVMIRSIFHVLWFLAIIVILVFFNRLATQRILLAAVCPFAIILLVYAKNYIVFNTISMGDFYVKENLVVMLRPILDSQSLSSIGGTNTTGMSQIPPFSEVSRYRAYIANKITSIPALDQEYKSTGAINYNNLAYIQIGDLHFKEVAYIIRTYPLLSLKRLSGYISNYFRPPSDGSFDRKDHNYTVINRARQIYSGIIYGRTVGDSSVRLHLLLGVPILIAFNMFIVVKSLLNKTGNVPLGVTALVMFITITLVNLACLLTWDQNRFRFDVDVYYLVLFGLLVNSLSHPRVSK